MHGFVELCLDGCVVGHVERKHSQSPVAYGRYSVAMCGDTYVTSGDMRSETPPKVSLSVASGRYIGRIKLIAHHSCDCIKRLREQDLSCKLFERVAW